MNLAKYIVYVAFLLLLPPLFSPFNTQADNTSASANNCLTDNSSNAAPTKGMAPDWVESTLQSLSPDERIAQLFMVAAYSNKDAAHEQSIANLITRYKIGGLIFMQGTPQKQVNLTNYYQNLSTKVPLLIAIDGEWGLSMRLENTPVFPHQLTLGSIQDNRTIYEIGREIARQCRRMGIHINFAPVADVNINPRNPVIGDRSFGENVTNVTEKAIAYIQGMEQNGVIACAKHFPGHGDTDKDSHNTLPVISHDRSRLESVELQPFRQIIQRGVGAIMIAHLSVPALDNTKFKGAENLTMPTTLSKKVVTQLLKNEMGFNGLVFTDALNMKGVSSYFEPGVVDVKALLAGNDVLLFSQDVSTAISEIKKAMQRGEITQEEIDSRVRKILKAKMRVGLNTYQPISTQNLQADLEAPQAVLNQLRTYEQALTLVRDDYRQIPFKNLETKRLASLAIGANTLKPFQAILGKYAPIEQHTLKNTDNAAAYRTKAAALADFHTVVISLHQMTKKASANYGLAENALNLIRELQGKTNVILVIFGSPYSLKNFEDIHTLLLAHEDHEWAQRAAAQALFGGIALRGRLPITASASFKYGLGIDTEPPIRFKYTIPEDVGINSNDLAVIDKIADEAIKSQATPGCQVLIAKDGKVIFEKAYGYLTYNQAEPAQSNDIYDLASVTKISATLLGLMKMYDNRALSITDPLKRYLPELDSTNKANLFIRDILIHEAGLKAWIPFYEQTLPENVRQKAFHTKPDQEYNIQVADQMYMSKPFQDMLWDMLGRSELPNKGEYKYSDLGFYYFKRIIESYSQKSLDTYLNETFYRPLGLTTLGYNPIDKFSRRRIAPTENDQRWRRQIVRGTVHDMGAAMMGGVCGHAGLFSNAWDLGVVMQMLLNGGSYGGRQFLNTNTIQTFTAQHKAGSRRGLGFDKPEINPRWQNPASDKASPRTFGHTGFTGTCAWADPDNKLVYIFLSNRTYPQMDNNKLQTLKTRIRIQDTIYEALEKAGLKK